jgi:hypothetical protein
MKKSSEAGRPSRTALGELDEIVIQLFDDLDGESLAAQMAKPATEFRAAAPHSPRRTADQRSAEPSGAELDEAEARESVVEDMPSQQLLEPDDESGTAQSESLSQATRPEAGIELSVPSDDQDFIERAVTWLAKRPNAEHLLEQIWLSVIEHAAAEERACGATDESDGGPPQPIPNLRYTA